MGFSENGSEINFLTFLLKQIHVQHFSHPQFSRSSSAHGSEVDSGCYNAEYQPAFDIGIDTWSAFLDMWDKGHDVEWR